MDERRVVYLEYSAAVRRYFRAVDRREEIETSPAWRNSPRYFEFLECAEDMVAKRRSEVAELRDELKKSPKLADKVFYYTNVEKQKLSYAAKMTGYSERQICRILGQIRDSIEKSLNE